MTVDTIDVVDCGIITDGSALVKNVLHITPDGDEYRVDVLMDKLNHEGRTRLCETEFHGNVYDMIKYALSNSSAKSYQLIRRDVGRQGKLVTQYTVVLN